MNHHEPMATDWRADVLERFSRWLAEAPEPGPEPPGAEPAPREDEPHEPAPPDLYTLFCEMAALKQEVRMQARAAHGAARAAEGTAAELRRASEARETDLDRAAESLRAMIPSARREGRAAVLAELLKVRESLQHASEAARGRRLPSRPWLRGAAQFVEQSAHDLRLVLAEADDALRRLGVVPVAELGAVFDPRTMRAVARGSGGQPGTVVEVVRQGFRSGDEILQTADVVVVAEEARA